MDEEDVGAGGGSPRAIEALRSVSGISLIVFPDARQGEVAGEGSGCMRAWLPAERRLADLDAAELAELREQAVPLTVTERLLEHEGDLWLVQATGPAWADPDEAAADVCGLLFTMLDGSARRYAVVGRAPGPLPDDDELRELLGSAVPGDA